MTHTRATTPVDAHVGAQIKKLRENANLSRYQLAHRVGVTSSQIQKYEAGTNRIGASRLWVFSQALGVDINRLFWGLIEDLGAANQNVWSEVSETGQQELSG